MTNSEFKQKVLLKHGDLVSVDERCVYTGYSNNVEVFCVLCNQYFIKNASKLLSGQGCQKCGRRRTTESKQLDTASFIELAKLKHGEKFDYSLTNYISSKAKVTIKCNTCKVAFDQTASAHLSGDGCKQCANNNLSESKLLSREQFIEKAKKLHGDLCDYSKVIYTGCSYNVLIICPNGHEFQTIAANHVNTARQSIGCPLCTAGHTRQ